MIKSVALAGIATTIVAGVLAAPLAASAGTTTAAKVTSSSSCGELKVTMKGFPAKAGSNSVKATLDGTTVVDYRFGSTYSFVFYVDNARSHNVTVKVTDRSGAKTTQTIKMVRCSFAS
jgi:uncharacterized membrane protein